MKVRAGMKKPRLLKIFLRLVTPSPRGAEERAQSNRRPVEESSNMPRVGRLDSRPFCNKKVRIYFSFRFYVNSNSQIVVGILAVIV